jgi:hypothetical protein
MQTIIRFSEQATHKMVKDDTLLNFRFHLLINQEGKTKREALHDIFSRLILDDPYRLDTYEKLIRTLA